MQKQLLALEHPTLTRTTKAVITGGLLGVQKGETVCLLGPNGSGKTTIAECVAGVPTCLISSGAILFDGVDVSMLSPDERARRGVYVAFQHVPEFDGVSAELFLYEAVAACSGKRPEKAVFSAQLKELCAFVGLDHVLLARPLFNNFSGGERKRFQLLEMLLMQPRLVVLDELDAGLDAAGIELFFATIARLRLENPLVAFLVITHNPNVIERLQPSRVYEISDQQIKERAL